MYWLATAGEFFVHKGMVRKYMRGEGVEIIFENQKNHSFPFGAEIFNALLFFGQFFIAPPLFQRLQRKVYECLKVFKMFLEYNLNG